MHNEPMSDHDYETDGESSAARMKLFALLRGRWHWAIILSLLLSVAGGYAAYMSEPELYQATSHIYISENIDRGGGRVDEMTEQYSTYVSMQMRRMQGAEVIDVAMEMPEFIEANDTRPVNLDPIDSTRAFAQGIEIAPPTSREPAVQIAYIDRDPKTAAASLNALLRAYGRVHSNERKSNDSEDLRTLTRLLQDQSGEEERLLDDLVRTVRREEIPILDNTLSSKLSALGIRERQLETLNLLLKDWVQANGQPTDLALQRLRTEDPQMFQLTAVRTRLEQELEYTIEVKQRGENHAEVLALRRAIGIAERDILELEQKWERGELIPTFPLDVQSAISEREGMIQTITQLSAEIEDLSRKKQKVDEINLELAELRSRMAVTNGLIDDHNADIMATETTERSQIKLGPWAVTPTEPYNLMKRRQLAVAGGMAGVMMGFGMVMVVGLMDRRLRHVADATLGSPNANVLGILPTLPANLKDPAEAEAAAHCVHHIRTLLQIGGNGRVFSVTSPTAGSGKSSLTSALGLSFATSGAKTLVIDCDLVGAGLSRRLGTVIHQPLDVIIRRHDLLDESQLDRAMTAAATEGTALDLVLLREGFMDEGEIERAVRLQRDTSLGVLEACVPGRLRSCVAAADVPNLFILPVGNARPADAGKISPSSIRSLIQQAREDFDIVLVDTGPVLGSLEASIAAAEADATVLIVSRGDQKTLVQRSLAQLESVNSNVAGIVFNHAMDNDLAHTSYASIVSQDRRPDMDARRKRLPDAAKVARYGPLGSAVASYSADEADKAELNGYDD